ncbi:MAG TPA: dihydropteroate synthase [Firmicutes bacterium]|jgi:dihydropteroate synthase|nr:dihydropteroate synthase [Bacillota bacterium]
MAANILRCGEAQWEIGKRTYIMGILNVTPDSFFDGGRFLTAPEAIERAWEMVAQGADIIDVGGFSTRPGHCPVSVEEEISRILPVIERLAAELPVPISVDTFRAEVAERALKAGAAMINDVWGLRADRQMAQVVARHNAAVVIMHNQVAPCYADLINEVKGFLQTSVHLALEAGISRDKIVVDPGFGFGKTAGHNLTMLRRLAELRDLSLPLLVGASRKSTIGKVLDLPVTERLEGTAATVALAIAGGCDMVRVHDVLAMKRVAKMADAVVRGWQD